MTEGSTIPSPRAQTIVGAGVLLVAAGMAFGALQISGEAGYGGVGPNFLPWLVAAVLAVCGAVLLWEARSGGFRSMDAPSGAAREANGAHAGLGARADQAHHVDRRHQGDDGFGQFDLALGGGAEREAFERGFLHRFEYRRMAVAQNHRAPRADVVDVALAVGVPHVSALRPGDKARRAADGLEGAHRRIDAAGNDGLGAAKQGEVVVSRSSHGQSKGSEGR